MSKSRAVAIRTRVIKVKSAKKQATGMFSNLPTIPLLLVAGLAPAVMSTYDQVRFNGPTVAGKHMLKIMTGYSTFDNRWRWDSLKEGLLPAMLGALGHKYIGGKLGINRALKAAGIPLFRL